MAGTKIGGQRAAATNKLKYGDSFYHKIGEIGGKAKVPKGFAKMTPEKVSAAGKKGGQISKKGPRGSYKPKHSLWATFKEKLG